MTLKEINDKISRFRTRINEMTSYEDRIVFLSEADDMKTYDRNAFYPRNWAERLGNSDSLEQFINHFSRPNKGTQLISEIWTGMGKVFKARDKTELYISNSQEEKEPPYLNVFGWWESEGYKLYQLHPNAFGLLNIREGKWVIDSIKTKQIEYFADDANGNAVELIYSVDENTSIHLALNVFEVYRKKNGVVVLIEVNSPYLKNAIPFFHVSSKKLNLDSETRTNHLCESFAEIADYVHECTLAKMNKRYLHSNIISRTVNADSCGFREVGAICKEGYLVSDTDSTAYLINEKGAKKECPSCRKKIAPGTELRVPLSMIINDSQTAAALTDSVNFKAPDTSAIETSKKDLEDTRKEIFGTATGKGQNIDANKNFNSELSLVMAAGSQSDALITMQKDLYPCMVQSFKATAAAFGFANMLFNFGQKFVLYTPEQLILIRKETDPLGLTDALRINEQLIDSASNGIESEKKRANVIITLNKLLGIEETARIIALFELEKMPIVAMTKSENEIIREIRTFAESNKKQVEPINDKEDEKTGFEQV